MCSLVLDKRDRKTERGVGYDAAQSGTERQTHDNVTSGVSTLWILRLSIILLEDDLGLDKYSVYYDVLPTYGLPSTLKKVMGIDDRPELISYPVRQEKPRDPYR